MSKKIANIAKNTSYFTLALIIQKIISFTYFTLYARYLGPADLGKYYFAISFTSVFSILIDLGLANVLTREIAKDKERAGKFVRNAIAIKIPLAIISWLAVVIIIYFGNYSGTVRQLVYVASVLMVLDSFATLFYSIMRGFHNLKFESISAIAYQLILLIFSFVIIHLKLSVEWIMLALLSASFLNFFYSAIVNILKWKIKLWPEIDKDFIKKIIQITLPFGIYAILQKIYTFTDSLLLFKFSGETAVGIYQIPFKIIMALQFLPVAFVASLYPAMSKYWKENRQQLAITFERAMTYSIIIALPIIAGIIILAPKLILIFKSGYGEAVVPLQIMIISLFFMFLSYPIGSLLNACDRQKENTINMLIVTIFSVSLNLLLIPRLGAIGASITMVISSLVFLILGWRLVHKIITYRFLNIVRNFGKTLLAVSFMAVFVYSFQNKINLSILIIIGAILYGILLFLLGGVKKADLESVLKSFRKK